MTKHLGNSMPWHRNFIGIRLGCLVGCLLAASSYQVEIGDIFDLKTDWKDGLANAIFGSDGIQSDGIQDEVSNPAGWALTKAGLEVDTDLYANGPYAAGAPSYMASWASLKPYLKPGGLVAPWASALFFFVLIPGALMYDPILVIASGAKQSSLLCAVQRKDWIATAASRECACIRTTRPRNDEFDKSKK